MTARTIVVVSVTEPCTDEWISVTRERWSDRAHLRAALGRLSAAQPVPVAGDVLERRVFELAEAAERSAEVYEHGLGLLTVLQSFLAPAGMNGVPVAHPVLCVVDGGPQARRSDIVAALGLDPEGRFPPEHDEIDTAQGRCLRIRAVGLAPLLGECSPGSEEALFCRVFHIWPTVAPGVFLLLTTQLSGFVDLAAYGDTVDDFARGLAVELAIR